MNRAGGAQYVEGASETKRAQSSGGWGVLKSKGDTLCPKQEDARKNVLQLGCILASGQQPSDWREMTGPRDIPAMIKKTLMLNPGRFVV